MSGIRVNEWLHNSGTGGIWQSSAGNVGIASSVPAAKLVVTGDVNVSGALTATNFNGGQLGNRNLIINGAMKVAQRGTSSTTSASYTADRYRVEFVGHDEAMTHAQHALTSSDTGPWAEGFRKSLHITNGNQTGGAGTGDYSRIEYRIEAQDVANSGWDYTSPASHLTLTYWVKSSVAQNFYNYVRSPDGTAQGYSWETGTLSADTWKKVTKTIPGNSNITIDDNTGIGLSLSFVLFFGTDFTDAGNTMNTWAAYASGNRMPNNTSTWYTTNDSTYEITGVQLEVGSVATPFEHRSYADELQKCLRYYWKCGGDNGDSMGIPGAAWATNYVTFSIQHPVHMRATPTYTGYNDCRFQAQTDSASFDASTMSIINTTVDGKTLVIAKSGTSGATVGQAGSLNSQEDGMYISFDAEL